MNRVKPGRDATIFIVGFCDESVRIVNDGIILSGNHDVDGSIDGGLREVIVNGARRTQVEFLELTGDGYGVLVQQGALVNNIGHNDIHGNQADSVGVFNQTFARVEFNRIIGNGRPEIFEAGIQASVDAKVRSRGNYVADNTYAVVEIGNLGYFRSGLSIPGVAGPQPDDRDLFLQKGCSEGQTASECAATAAAGTTPCGASILVHNSNPI